MGNPLMPSLTSRTVPFLPSEVTPGAGLGAGVLPQKHPLPHTASSTLGQYCYELDEKAVKPGYPKRIQDVWGIEGPIDAAFTRINCQGKTYLFKVPGCGSGSKVSQTGVEGCCAQDQGGQEGWISACGP